jgi:hypothetical protein
MGRFFASVYLTCAVWLNSLRFGGLSRHMVTNCGSPRNGKRIPYYNFPVAHFDWTARQNLGLAFEHPTVVGKRKIRCNRRRVNEVVQFGMHLIGRCSLPS